MATTDFKVIGTRPIRHDGTDKVTGRAKYGGDTAAADLLHAKILRSPHAHARIVSIDTSKAAAHPGVRGVITGMDLPELGPGTIEVGETPSVNAMQMSTNVMARTKVLYKGHAVAAVAADSPYSSVVDGRFRGGHITRAHGAPADNVHAMQLELTQRNYMDEVNLEYDADRAARLVDIIRSMLQSFMSGKGV